MAVTYDKDKKIKEDILKRTYSLTCTNPRCFTTWTIEGKTLDRTLKEEGSEDLRCPKCGAKSI